MSAVRFDHISKQFTLYHERPRSFQELFLNLLNRKRSSAKERYWALNDVSFEIETGEMVGIIGRNGAGKSTILKLISRIIEPTSGQIEVNGRVGALLELGAGFHPDLTGRENVYLNGSILGLSRKEIDRQFDEIVAFAELERFIDVPVKRNSSGMFVRLGFSIAVHTRPDLLLIDEVLAVGDAAFQQKCLEKIAEFRHGESTIVFVSHDLKSVQQLCSRTIWLEDGQIRQIGEADRVIASYVAVVEKGLEAKLGSTRKAGPGAARAAATLRLSEVKMVDEGGKPRWTFRSGEPLSIHIAYECTSRVDNPVFGILIHRSDGLYVSSTNTHNIDPLVIGPIEGQGELIVNIDHLDLYAGDYFLSVGAYLEPNPPYWSSPAHFLDKQFKFRVVSEGRHGVLVLPATWEHRSRA
jgi:ABC-type polysaccharide/polyol phosphate transport system ATPase subunit